MNLKDSYRYAGFLDELLEQAYEMLANINFITTVEQRHIRSRIVEGAEDEVLVRQKAYAADIRPMEVVDLAVAVLAEKEALMKAIADAKAVAAFNIDNAVAMNRKRQQFIRALDAMLQVKTSIRNTVGRIYHFNVNNEQVPYVYDIQEITTIDFTRGEVRRLIQKCRKGMDEISAKLDRAEIMTEVSHVPRWGIDDDFEDVLEEVIDNGWYDTLLGKHCGVLPPENEIPTLFTLNEWKAMIAPEDD